MSETKLASELEAKQQYCSGCRDDFYNHDGHAMNGSHCWCLEDAKVVERYRIGWWTQPTSAKAFQKVTTLSCHYAPGQYAHYEKLPEHCR
ncbi:MAG TPA: hypothetical protein VFB63_00675 [Bryobacteraceae bacterium]|nr:hypothetical protein [Bryobacteraceae bacterium]